MPADMLDLQETKLHGFEELLTSYDAAAAVGSGEEEAAAIADFFVDEGIGLHQSALRLWENQWTMVLGGKIKDRKARGAKIRGLLERTAAQLTRYAAVARDYAHRYGRDVPRLAEFEAHCQAFPVWIEECMARWDLLDRPRTLNRDAIDSARSAFRGGACQDIGDIVARLEVGRSLAQE